MPDATLDPTTSSAPASVTDRDVQAAQLAVLLAGPDAPAGSPREQDLQVAYRLLDAGVLAPSAAVQLRQERSRAGRLLHARLELLAEELAASWNTGDPGTAVLLDRLYAAESRAQVLAAQVETAFAGQDGQRFRRAATVQVADVFARANTLVEDAAALDAELAEIADKAAGSLALAWAQDDGPLAALADLLTVVAALRQVLGMAPSMLPGEVFRAQRQVIVAAVEALVERAEGACGG